MNLKEKRTATTKTKLRLARNILRAAKVVKVFLNPETPKKKKNKALLLFFRISLRIRVGMLHVSTIASQPTSFSEGGFIKPGGEIVSAMLMPKERIINEHN